MFKIAHHCALLLLLWTTLVHAHSPAPSGDLAGQLQQQPFNRGLLERVEQSRDKQDDLSAIPDFLLIAQRVRGEMNRQFVSAALAADWPQLRPQVEQPIREPDRKAYCRDYLIQDDEIRSRRSST